MCLDMPMSVHVFRHAHVHTHGVVDSCRRMRTDCRVHEQMVTYHEPRVTGYSMGTDVHPGMRNA